MERSTVVLELLQVRPCEASWHVLVEPLFSLLQASSQALTPAPDAMEVEEATNPGEYVEMLCLNVLRSLAQEEAIVAKGAFSVPAVVASLQGAASTQVRNGALLVLAALAQHGGSTVLEDILPVFTTMAGHDDDYSYAVIEQTVRSIVPSALQGGTSAEEVLQLLLGALPEVPPHRQIPLFSAVVSSLGPGLALFMVPTLEFQRHWKLKHSKDSSGPPPPTPDPFCHALFEAFSAEEQAQAQPKPQA